jgi:carbonic anhydrase
MTTPQQLIDGFRRFRERHFADDDALYRHLVEGGQTARILVVACCDSRVDPAIVLDCSPGDLFVIRNVANLVPPAEERGSSHHGTSAALEFGVRNLGVSHIIILGHARCGGIRALMQAGDSTATDSFVGDWMQLAAEARAAVERDLPNATPEAQLRDCEQRSILISMRNLMTFSWVRERVERGELELHGWYFDIEQGQLLHYDAAVGAFAPL